MSIIEILFDKVGFVRCNSVVIIDN